MESGFHHSENKLKVYKFLDTNFGVSDIALKRVMVSRLNTLNDPFEFLAADVLDPRDRNALSAFKNQLHETSGIICFSGSWSNPLLWGHYANNHNGMALGFEVPDEHILKAHYTSQRVKIKFNQNTQKVVDGPKVIDKLIRTKFTDWSYEDEYRIFIELAKLKEEAGYYFLDFSPTLQLREVILGMNCDLSVERLHQLLGSELGNVRARRAKMAYREFKMVEDRSFRI